MTASDRTTAATRLTVSVPAAAATSVGVDLVDVARIARLATGPVGLARVLTVRELEYCSARKRSYHPYSEEFLYVVSGEISAELDDTPRPLAPRPDLGHVDTETDGGPGTCASPADAHA